VNPLFDPLDDSWLRFAGREAFQLFVSSEARTYLNSDRGEKLREDEWLISAILREINHLEWNVAGEA